MNALLALLVAVPALAADPPAYEECALITPSITVGDDRIDQGRGWVAEVGDRQLFVTSLQTMGPAGGHSEQLAASAVHDGFTQLVARDAFTGKECGRAKRVLKIDAEVADLSKAATDDVMAFLVAKTLDTRMTTAIKPMKLADAAPAKGEAVFLATRTSSKGRVVAGKVADSNDKFIFYDFPQVDQADLMGSVGSPVLNGDGKVVGMQVAIGKLEDGTLFGAANPVTSLKAKLAAEALPEKVTEE